jgi:phytanoyl-CoA hydroxylase
LNLAFFAAMGDYDINDRVHVIAEPGDVVFFHPLLLHGTGRNRTEGYRRVSIAHYASSECKYMENGEQFAKMRHYTLVRGKEFEGCL